MQRAAEIAIYYSHTRPNGESCFTCTYDGARSYGENIAAGYTTAESVFTGWREDNENYNGQGHRRNMLDRDFNTIGIGHVYYNGVHYWVQEFGIYRSGLSQTTANDAETNANVEIAKSSIKSMSNTVSNDNVRLEVGAKVAAPTVQTTVKTTEGWPAGRNMTIDMDYTWNVSDANIVKIENGEIIGLNPGKATLTLSIDSSVVVNVEVTEKSINSANIELENTEYKYDKTEKTPAVKVTIDGVELPKRDYKVTYANNTEVGTASVTVEGIGEYSGTKTVNFSIICYHPENQRELVNTVEPTETEEGYKGDLICSYCGQLLEKGEVIPVLGEKKDSEENNNSTDDKVTESNKEENKQENKDVTQKGEALKDSANPKTGDNFIELWIALVVISGASIVVALRFIVKKETKN